MYASIDRANEFGFPGCCCVWGFTTCSSPAHPLKRDECFDGAESRFKIESRSRASPGRGRGHAGDGSRGVDMEVAGFSSKNVEIHLQKIFRHKLNTSLGTFMR